MPHRTDTAKYALALVGALVPLLLGAAAVRPCGRGRPRR